METIVSMPVDLYDPRWAEYNRQNPGLYKSVGPAATPEEVKAEADAAAKAEADKAVADAKAAKDAEDAKKQTPEQLAAKVAELEAEKAKLVKETMSRKDKLKEEAAAKAKLETDLASIKDQMKALLGDDFSLDDLQKKIDDKKAAEIAALKKAGDFEALSARQAAEHKKEVDKLNGSYGAKVSDLEAKVKSGDTEIRRLLVSNAFASSAFIKGELVMTPGKAEKLFGEHFKVEEIEGKREVRAYLGTEPLVDAAGKPFGFEESLREIVNRDPEKDSLFKSKAKPGAGSGVDNTGKDIENKPLRGMAAIKAGLDALPAKK